MQTTPIALTIAGSDSSGGAGIQADLKAMSALGVYGASVVTAVTAQNTRGVTAVEALSPDLVAAQIEAVLGDLAVGAIKIGMLASPTIIEAVTTALAGRPIPVVLDPVMVAKSGDALLRDEAVAALRDTLLPHATLVTPNLPEAARLLGLTPAENLQEVMAQGRALLAMGPAAVLMKGGHARGDTCRDVLLRPQADAVTLSAPRLPTRNTHGTGCTLSAAIAAGLAGDRDLEAAVRQAHAYLQGALRAADRLAVGGGHGPVHHFHALWNADV